MMNRFWVTIKRDTDWILFTAVALVMVLIGCWIARDHWSWLRAGGSATDSNGDTLRTVGILIGGAVAFVFGLWRTWLGGLQTHAAQNQAEAARAQVQASQSQVEAVQRQAEIAQQGLLNERYQRGAEMLSSRVLTARLGGIYALQRLAEEQTDQYQAQILRLLCAFARDPDGDWETRTLRAVMSEDILRHSLRQDVQAAVEGISSFLTSDVSGYSDGTFYVDLRKARLNGIHLEGGDLSGVDLSWAELVRADLENTNFWAAQLRLVQLQDSNLQGADLSHATITGANLSEVNLNHATLNRSHVIRSDLGGATFYEASLAGVTFLDTPITQAQLDQTRVDPQNPPRFRDGAVDHSTGIPLRWHGEPFG